MHLLELREVDEFLHFDKYGDLTHHGELAFWTELNKQIQLFDTGKIELPPAHVNATRFQFHQQLPRQHTHHHRSSVQACCSLDFRGHGQHGQ